MLIFQLEYTFSLKSYAIIYISHTHTHAHSSSFVYYNNIMCNYAMLSKGSYLSEGVSFVNEAQLHIPCSPSSTLAPSDVATYTQELYLDFYLISLGQN